MGQYTPVGFLILNETLYYLNLVSNLSLCYVLRKITRNGSLIPRGSILLKLEEIMVLFQCKNVGEVPNLLPCTFSDNALYLYQVFFKYFKCFKVFSGH